MLRIDGIELTFTKTALEQIAENTLKLKTGARGLHTELERVLMPHMYNSSRYKQNDITLLVIDANQVLEPKEII